MITLLTTFTSDLRSLLRQDAPVSSVLSAMARLGPSPLNNSDGPTEDPAVLNVISNNDQCEFILHSFVGLSCYEA